MHHYLDKLLTLTLTVCTYYVINKTQLLPKTVPENTKEIIHTVVQTPITKTKHAL